MRRAEGWLDAGERSQFGQKIADFQLIKAMIADSNTETMAARALVLQVADQKDAGDPITLETAMPDMNKAMTRALRSAGNQKVR